MHLITARIDHPSASDSIRDHGSRNRRPRHLGGGNCHADDGGKDKNRHLTVTVLVHADGQPGGGISVTVEIRNENILYTTTIRLI